MAIFRIHHHKNYTTISNSAIQDSTLSFKARGLHHLLLSYPDNWEVNISHLCKQSDKDGRDSIASALKELREAGYITQSRERDERGQLGKSIYDVFETSQSKSEKSDPGEQHPKQENHEQENPEQKNPSLENSLPLINTNKDQILNLPSTFLYKANDFQEKNQASSIQQEMSFEIPQPTVPQPTVPQPTVPQPTVPQPTVPQPTVPQPTMPPVNSLDEPNSFYQDQGSASLSLDNIPVAYQSGVARAEARFNAGAVSRPWEECDRRLKQGFREYVKNTLSFRGKTEVQLMDMADTIIRKARYTTPGQHEYDRVADKWAAFMERCESADTAAEAVGKRISIFDRFPPRTKEA